MKLKESHKINHSIFKEVIQEVPTGMNLFLVWQLMESMAGEYLKKAEGRHSSWSIHLYE